MRTIVDVRDEAGVAAVKALIHEFVEWLHERYPEMKDAIETYFASQGFEAEMADLLSVYGSPGGACLLAVVDDEPVGCLMMKPRDEDVVEMNRMFVRESARGQGVARALADTLIERAHSGGYKSMILSALDRHDEALGLYHKLGFQPDVDREADSGDGEREVRLKLDLSAASRP